MTEAAGASESQGDRAFRLSEGGSVDTLLGASAPGRSLRTNRRQRILAGVTLTWGVLFVLCAIEGALTNPALEPAFLGDPIAYGRFLVALPILLSASFVVDKATGAVVRYLRASGLVPEEERPSLEDAIGDLERRRDARWVDFALLVLALGVTAWIAFFSAQGSSQTGSANWIARDPAARTPTLAGWWYLVFCLPLFQFVMFRWFYRFLIWVRFLHRVSRLRLRLLSTHPDLAGGIGVVSIGQNAFCIVFMACAAMMSAVLAREILYDGSTLAESKAVVIGFVILAVLVLLLPLTVFFPVLLRTKRQGMVRYGILAEKLSLTFEERWIEGKGGDPHKLVDTGETSALSDYAADYDTIRRMRLTPVAPRSAIKLGLVLLIPFVPLVFTDSSLKELIRKLAGILT